MIKPIRLLNILNIQFKNLLQIILKFWDFCCKMGKPGDIELHISSLKYYKTADTTFHSSLGYLGMTMTLILG